jgi:multisubunit Na+/H+ antiporter MnhB subunit
VSRRVAEPDLGRGSMILDVIVRGEFHVLMVVSIYLLFAGHNAPGGGFVGGLVAAAACALRMAAQGPRELRRSIRVRPMTVLGMGLTVGVVSAIAAFWNDGGLLQTRYLKVEVPFIGPVSTSTAFFFDLGVYLVVVGAVLCVLEALGAPEEEAS